MKVISYPFTVYPHQAVLLTVNSSIFTHLHFTAAQFLNQSDVMQAYNQYVPDWLKQLTGNSVVNFQSFIERSSWTWLVATIVLVLIWKFISKVLKIIFTIIILVLGIWLLWQQNLLHQFLG